MLSKNNKILIACLALLLVMSVGYALFSDTITINGSATAKGDFELTTTCDEDDSLTPGSIGSVTDVKISCEGNVVNASATLGYPGSVKWFRVMVTNTGTIPAKLKKVVELNNPETYICESGNCSFIVNVVKNEDNTNVVSAEMLPDDDWQGDYADGQYGVASSWSEWQMDAVLDPGETAHYYIRMEWSNRSTTPGEPLTVSMNAQLDWEQVTE